MTRIGQAFFGSTALAAVALSISMGAASADPLKLVICHVDDRSGSAADTGIESLNGLKMVLDPLNEAGGINGQKIELITYDTKTDPQLAANFGTRCAEDDGGLMIIGGSPSAVANSLVTVANQSKIPLYILAAAAPNVTDNAVYQYRFGPKVTQDSIAVAEAFAANGIKKVAIINNSVPFGISGAASATEELGKKGIEITTQQTYDVAATDVSPQVINLMQSDPEVILVYPYPADGARVVRTIRQMGLKQPVIMPRVGMMKAFRDLAAETGNDVLVPSSVDTTRAEVAEFFKAYAAKYGPLAISPSPVQGYDAGTLAVAVLKDEKVQEAIKGGDVQAARDAIRDATARHGDFTGLQGTANGGYRFSQNHHGPTDTGFFVFVKVAENGAALEAVDSAVALKK
ncbi:ABC transporter substrate-binding protein [Mesorhizobium australicum]|uniref:Amino acid/amide ABC transporter substrate-binding protein, HAAT family n=1 Tax=Mesorhizobium australicum TaxID=536018 RepID=A0A1X7PTU9_9HYPH|nr:ABC transporter substrate-binding protein [Mesorhizobium australicum]SMH54743.1 amino acid/amide ABC transporter substrate-binding protein, HAAT family [Mesorhizobium australicum]